MTLQDKRSMMLALVDQWRQSGLSQAEFARVHDMKLVKLRYNLIENSIRPVDYFGQTVPLISE